MVINSGFIFRDQSGEILEKGTGAMILVLAESEDNPTNFKVMEIPREDEEFSGDIFEVTQEDLELIKYHSNIHKLIDRI